MTQEKHPRHVDDFIVSPSSDSYAAFMLHFMRLPAIQQMRFRPFISNCRLFCNWNETNRRYRVTGASRLGDVWLAEDFTRDVGYDVRVNVDDCTNWGDRP